MVATLLKRHRWLVVAILIFVCWKFLLIHTMWQGRALPPEPDDSLIYQSYIYATQRCPTWFCENPNISFKNYSGYNFIAYQLVWGGVAKALNLEAQTVLHLSFYLGTLLLVPSLIFLINRLVVPPTPDPTAQRAMTAFLLTITALYNGTGAYHGFFWVVPTFFAVLLFFVVTALLLAKKPHAGWLMLSVPLMVLTHPISKFLPAIFVLYTIFYCASQRRWERLLIKKTVLVVVLAALTTGAVSLALQRHNQVNPHSVSVIAQQVTQATLSTPAPATATSPPESQASPNTSRFKSLNSVISYYVRWLMPHWLGVLPLIAVVVVLVRGRQSKLLALYAATVVFVGVASLQTYGHRALAVLWPLTFLLYAAGFWLAVHYLVHRPAGMSRTLLLTVWTVALVVFVTINVVYSFLFNQAFNQRHNVSFSPEFASYLLTQTEPTEAIAFEHKLVRSYAQSTPLIDRLLLEGRDRDKAAYYVQFSTYTPTQFGTRSRLQHFLHVVLLALGRNPQPDLALPLPTQKGNPGPAFELEKTFENIEVYRRLPTV